MEENKEEKQEEMKNRQGVLVSFKSVYTSKDELCLYILNKEGTRLKKVLTNEVKGLSGEVCFFDVLTGDVETDIDEKILNDIRNFFKMTRRIGFSDKIKYDFSKAQDATKLYKLSLFEDIQKSNNASSGFLDF